MKSYFVLQHASKGEILLSIPLRLAITDYPDDKAGNEALGRGSPSNLRLALKLLQQHKAGEASQWFPFLQVFFQRL